MFKILCVEDTPEVRLILKATLAAYELSFAPTMKSALELIEKEKFSLFLMDI